VQQKKVNQKKALLNMIKHELDQRNASIKHLNNVYNDLEKKSKLPNVAKNLSEFKREKDRLVKKNEFEK
jgi:flagellar biosynthesis/type III secretory pathway chaperone